MSREIHVFADWDRLDGPTEMGVLRAIESRGDEVFAFSYADSWLQSGTPTLLDPDLRWFSGPQYLNDENRPNFGLFLDSCPDRWGRLIMRRREAILARMGDRSEKRLGESDYLLGVHDEQRMGALRFCLDPSGPFLSDAQEMTAPPWASLRELEQASWQVQSEDGDEDQSALGWLNLLLAPGSSLGGARPKAGVRDPEGDLWIAKFPGRNDDRDVGAWEWLVWKLAQTAGIDVPEARLLDIGGSHRTFASRRFDRVMGSSGKRRLHFASAMTLLGYNDGANHEDGASYLELAEFLIQRGARAKADLEEVWRRMVFSVCVSNTDDHLRNHGFILTNLGWQLSPAYDLNADPLGQGLSLNLSDSSNALSLDLAMEVATYFQVKPVRAKAILEEVRSAVGSWEVIAGDLGIPRSQQSDMRRAFERGR